MPLFIVVGVILFIYGVWLIFFPAKEIKNPLEKDTMSKELQIWNEAEISRELVRLQNRPAPLRHYVESIKQRFIDNQNIKTAQVRSAFLAEQLKFLEQANQYKDLEHALALKTPEHENRLLKVALEHQQLSEEKDLQRLENERRRAEIQLQIAKLEKERDELATPPKQELPLTEKEIRKQKRKKLKKRIEKINQLLIDLKEDEELSDEDKQRQINQLERKRFDLEEQLLDLL